MCGHEEGWKGEEPRVTSSADKTRRVSGSWRKAETGPCALNIWFYPAELLQTTYAQTVSDIYVKQKLLQNWILLFELSKIPCMANKVTLSTNADKFPKGL